jgi:hypothetical protein
VTEPLAVALLLLAEVPQRILEGALLKIAVCVLRNKPVFKADAEGLSKDVTAMQQVL